VGGIGSLRIVAGAKRGHRLKVPNVAGLRPTGEKVREAMFDVLGPVGGLRGLDLFAGTGALGLEALSRGAASCVFVEADLAVAAVLQGNIRTLGYEQATRVVVSDYRPAAGLLAAPVPAFDLLFLDPPYRMLPDVEVALSPLLPGLVTSDGLVVIEGPRATRVSFGQVVVFDRLYGDTRIVMVKLGRECL
jgi:16S rRNA (guanine966-N2)-methyltransferase